MQLSGQSPASAIFLLPPGWKTRGAHWMENRAGPTASLKILEKGKLPAPVYSVIIQVAIYRLQPTECSMKTVLSQYSCKM